MTLCRDPYVKGGLAFPCGNCQPCRHQRRKLWANRIQLENMMHSVSSFLTLTYADAHLPVLPNGMSTLEPWVLQKFMKRIRVNAQRSGVGLPPSDWNGRTGDDRRLRFFAVGEYGRKGERAHYHIALFGFGPCYRGTTLRIRDRSVAERCCPVCRLVSASWGRGDIDIGIVEPRSAKYLARYTLKKLTRFDDQRLGGRHPEFARQSLNPGLGYHALWEIADVIMRHGLDETLPDVPTCIRVGGKLMPLGRYLRQQLRKMIGREVKCPDTVLQEAAQALQPLREIADVAPIPELRRIAFKNAVIEAFEQRALNSTTLSHIFSQKGNL